MDCARVKEGDLRRGSSRGAGPWWLFGLVWSSDPIVTPESMVGPILARRGDAGGRFWVGQLHEVVVWSVETTVWRPCIGVAESRESA